MITVICYWFWLLWNVEIENVTSIKGCFAVISTFEFAFELIMLCLFTSNIIDFFRGVKTR